MSVAVYFKQTSKSVDRLEIQLTCNAKGKAQRARRSTASLRGYCHSASSFGQTRGYFPFLPEAKLLLEWLICEKSNNLCYFM